MENDEIRISKSESITNDEVQNARAEKRLTLATPADLICENPRRAVALRRLLRKLWMILSGRRSSNEISEGGRHLSCSLYRRNIDAE